MRWTVNLSPKKKIELCLDQALNLKSAISYKAALDKNRDATGIQTVERGRKNSGDREEPQFSSSFSLIFNLLIQYNTLINSPRGVF